jgi:hypothetical protein
VGENSQMLLWGHYIKLTSVKGVHTCTVHLNL